MSARIQQVFRSEDFDRICALAVRAAPGTPEAERQKESDNREFTNLLLTREGRRAGAAFQGWQGYCCREIYENSGGYLSLPVGSGKTLLHKVAPVLLNSQRPVYVIPASLREKTHQEFAQYAVYWKSPAPGVQQSMLAYNELTHEANVQMLARLQPDLYNLDEVDKLSNQDASAVKRIGRDVDARLPSVVAMTGTGSRHRISDFEHFLIWALLNNAPIPLDPHQRMRWGRALDAKSGDPRRIKRMQPGVLCDLAEVYEDQLDIFREWDIEITDTIWARIAFQNRLCATPGVVIVDEDSCDQPLTISLVNAPEDPKLNRAYAQYFETEQTPDGWDLPTSLERYLFEQQLGCGFYFVYDPRPPEFWCEGRRAWNKFCRWQISHSNRSETPLDTEKAVKSAFRHHEKVKAWARIEPQFKPNSKAIWVSDSVVHCAAKWARSNVGLVFVANEVLGRRIAEATGLRYYGAGGVCEETGGSIENADPKRSAVLSIAANTRGRNLQGWCNAYIIGCPQSARDLEQLLGREHRYMQKRPVHYTILQTSGLSRYGFKAAINEARFVLQTQGQTQKILRALIKQAPLPSNQLRWTRRDREIAA